ncbi:MAG: hypothetical protein J5606_06935 [Bacteroidales bacterium]|nr:hypothetical protein [Bacteroidales bacterium]
MKKHHIILLTTWYPPRHSIAVNRMLAFAKYIDKTKFDVDVVSLQSDEKMEKDIAIDGVSVHRLPNKALLKRAKFDRQVCFVFHKLKALYNVLLAFFVKREYRNWQHRAEKQVRSLLEKYGPDTTIISSYEPIEPHLVAIALKKQGCSFFWVADCRDEITQNPSVTKGLRKLYAKAERQMLLYADAVTTVSQPILEGFKRNVPANALHCPLFAEVRNGYDFDYVDTEYKNDVFTIMYAGTFYSNIKPYTFFKALQCFLSKNPNARLKVNLIGVGHSVVVPHDLTCVVFSGAKIPHEDALIEMQNSDCLLLILPKQNRKGVYSGKLFEYLGCRKPILAVVDPDDVAADLIRECNAGVVADFDDVQSIASAIEKLYNMWQKDEKLPMNEDIIKKHHRKEQVEILNKLIFENFYLREGECL